MLCLFFARPAEALLIPFEASGREKTSDALKCVSHSAFTLTDAEPGPCPISISYVTQDRDELQVEAKSYPLVTKGRRTWLQCRHQQFALSGLTGSRDEAERGSGVGGFCSGPMPQTMKRKRSSDVPSGAKMEEESRQRKIANVWRLTAAGGRTAAFSRVC